MEDEGSAPASERLKLDLVVQQTPFWRLKSFFVTLFAAALSAGDYHPGLVPETKVSLTDRVTGGVVYVDTVRWSVNAAEGVGAALQDDLDSMDLATFCAEYGIDARSLLSVAPD